MTTRTIWVTASLKIVQRGPRRLGRMVQKHAEQDPPNQDADVIGVQHRINRVVYELEQQCPENLGDALWCVLADLSHLQRDCRWKKRTHSYSQQRCGNGADEIHDDDGPHLRRMAGFTVGDRRGDKHQYENRRYSLQGGHKQRAEKH